MNIRNNHIHDCDNGGKGPWGNGINVYRAVNVSIIDNYISDCAFSAIRANSASNIRISDNSCFGSGETALYVEFAFQGAVVTGNLIDGGTMGISIANFDSGGRMSVISGNLIRKAPIGIAVSVVDGAKSTSITNNIFDEISRGAIISHEWPKPVTKDLSLTSKPTFPHLQIAGNIVK